jgi:hypothetical protein
MYGSGMELFFKRRHEVPDFELTKPPTASLVQGADQK